MGHGALPYLVPPWNGGFSWEINDRWCIFGCHVEFHWIPIRLLGRFLDQHREREQQDFEEKAGHRFLENLEGHLLDFEGKTYRKALTIDGVWKKNQGFLQKVREPTHEEGYSMEREKSLRVQKVWPKRRLLSWELRLRSTRESWEDA